MTFTYKLSRRLALLKDRGLRFSATALGVLAIFACEQPIKLTSPTPPNGSVVQVVIVPDTVTLNPYQTQQFIAYGLTQAGDSVAAAVSWSVSGGAIRTDGMYTADTIAGTYLVTATVQSAPTAPGATASASPPVSGSSHVKNRGLLAQVVETPTAASVLVGRTAQFTAYGVTKSGDSVAVSVTWSSSNPAVATVNSSGLMTAMAAGSATINAASQNKSGTATATITNVPVASVLVSPATAGVTVGASTQLTAIPEDSSGTALSGRTVTWATSNAAIATVSASGLVTGVAAGSATITATSEGKSGTSAVTVTNVPVASVTVTPATANLLVGATLQLTAVPQDNVGNPLSGRVVTWTSNAPGVATVSGTGLVTGVGLGAVTIMATSEGQSGSSAVTVSLVSDSLPLYALGTGNNYYAAPTGSDANPCTAAAPCYSMARVAQLMSPGDNAHFAAGNYTWSYSSNQVSKSGTASAPISYISDTKWGAKIYGTDCSPISNNGAYVQIINFDVTGSCVQSITTNGSYSKIIGNRIHDVPGTQAIGAIVGDCCGYGSTGIQIIGNVLDNIGSSWGQVNQTHGIYIASANGVIENNIVTRAASACIQSYHGATHLIISNNVVANCGRYGIQISADPTVTVNDYTTVDNNIVVNGGGYGIHEGYSLGANNVYYNNIFYNNPSGNLWSDVQVGNITLTSAQFSALFVNYTGDMTGDYHLQSGAVAIDAGTTVCAAGVPLCVPGLDIAGILRPQGAAYDIGAYEWH